MREGESKPSLSCRNTGAYGPSLITSGLDCYLFNRAVRSVRTAPKHQRHERCIAFNLRQSYQKCKKIP